DFVSSSHAWVLVLVDAASAALFWFLAWILVCVGRQGSGSPPRFRCAGPLQELQGGRGGIWIDTCQVSVGRERPHRRNITVWRRDDADDAVRSGPKHAGAFDEMVLAQGLGDEDRQASRDEEGDRGAGASVGRDHASRVG